LDEVVSQFEHSPITGIHLWFDRPITFLEHAMLVDRQIQWMFHKGCGYYLIVVSASRNLESKSTAEIVDLAVEELQDFFPAARHASLERSRVIREARATFSARPGLERWRPGPCTRLANVFLAGDWTATGWPATMEGAVRSGYAAAEAILRSAGSGIRR
jgi:zeta-carotene desaturase